jgi:DNA polymerase III delta prime subunit
MSACTNSTPSQHNPANASPDNIEIQNRARFIIKFFKPLSFSDVAKKLQEISEQTGVKFTYLREMSGNAHVIIAQYIYSDEKFAELLADIKKRDDVEYVEIDALVHHQNNQ